MRVELRQRQQVVEAENAPGRGPLEQNMQEVARGQRVVERAVTRLMVEAQARRERAEATVGHLVSDQAAGEGARIDERVGEARPAGALERDAEKAGVEAHV